MSDLLLPQTDPRRDGNKTSEHFWHKVSMILGIVIAVVGFVGDSISIVTGVLPVGSTAMKWTGVAGSVVVVISKISYEIQRMLIKNKLIDAEIAAVNAPLRKTDSDAAATVLGEDSPQ
jgi:hypothetical protein